MRHQDRISYFLLVYLDPHDFYYSNQELRRHIVESYREKISFTLTMLSDWMSLVRPPWERRAGLVCTSKRFTSPAIVLICTSVSLPAVNSRIHEIFHFKPYRFSQIQIPFSQIQLPCYEKKFRLM